MTQYPLPAIPSRICGGCGNLIEDTPYCAYCGTDDVVPSRASGFYVPCCHGCDYQNQHRGRRKATAIDQLRFALCKRAGHDYVATGKTYEHFLEIHWISIGTYAEYQCRRCGHIYD